MATEVGAVRKLNQCDYWLLHVYLLLCAKCAGMCIVYFIPVDIDTGGGAPNSRYYVDTVLDHHHHLCLLLLMPLLLRVQKKKESAQQEYRLLLLLPLLSLDESAH